MDSRKFLATCWVMVEAPTGRRPEPMFCTLVSDGAAEAVDVDAGMVVEILVLGRQERGLDAVRDRLDRQEEPPLAGDIRPSARRPTAWTRVVTGGS